MNKLIALVGAVTVSLAISSASANAATCPEPGVDLGRVFTMNESSGCYAYGEGNVNGNPSQDPLLNGMTVGSNTLTFSAGQAAIEGLVLLDKSDETSNLFDGAIQGWVKDATSGTVTITSAVSGYTNLILAIKSGNNVNPSWGAFNISGPGTFTWSISPQGGNSHMTLYGVIPLPAAGWLLLAGVGGLAAMRRRKKGA